MKRLLLETAVFCILLVVTACTNENLEPIYKSQVAGKIVIRGYNAATDSVHISINGEFLEINDRDAFTGQISNDFEFVFYDEEPKYIAIINKTTKDTLQSYTFLPNTPIDTLSFYSKPDFYLDEVLSFKPGELSASGQTGYRFIFPTLNLYSGSGYDGPLDGILRKVNGQQLGVVENISKTAFSSFAEFAFSSPPIIKMELVKHGTTESYIPGQQVFVTMVMASNKSRLVVLEETVNDTANFLGVNGTIDLVEYFDF